MTQEKLLEDAKKSRDLHLVLEQSLPFQLSIVYQIDKCTLNWALNLVKLNLKEMYEQAEDFGGWNEPSKREEMADSNGRYLIARDSNHQLAGFLYFQFIQEETLDGTAAVIYIFEIEIENKVRKRGLGKALMKAAHAIGKAQKLEKIMLTVFKSNLDALQFYEKLGYELDEISPDLEDDDYSYVILSRKL